MRTTIRLAALTMGLAATSPAFAQAQFFEHGTPLISAGPGYTQNGLGSPSVAFDTQRNRYLMVFEYRIGPAANCPGEQWGLGIAQSSDGIGWTVNPTPLLTPTAGTFGSCVAAHPAIMYNDGNDTLHVWFKAEQEDNVIAPCPTWGCGQYTGVGRARVTFTPIGQVDTVTVPSTNPEVATGVNFGFPKVVQEGSDWFMMLTQLPDAYVAIGSNFNNMVLDPTPVLSPQPAITWAEDELFNGALVCEDAAQTFPFASFLGGRRLSGVTILEAGWGKSLGEDYPPPVNPWNWFFGAVPYFTWSGASDWRHWDVNRVGATEYLVYYSEKDGNGDNQIMLGYSDSSFANGGCAAGPPACGWANADFSSKRCP